MRALNRAPSERPRNSGGELVLLAAFVVAAGVTVLTPWCLVARDRRAEALSSAVYTSGDKSEDGVLDYSEPVPPEIAWFEPR